MHENMGYAASLISTFIKHVQYCCTCTHSFTCSGIYIYIYIYMLWYIYIYVVMRGQIKSTATHYITVRYTLRVLYQLPMSVISTYLFKLVFRAIKPENLHHSPKQRVHDDINYLCHVRGSVRFRNKSLGPRALRALGPHHLFRQRTSRT